MHIYICIYIYTYMYEYSLCVCLYAYLIYRFITHYPYLTSHLDPSKYIRLVNPSQGLGFASELEILFIYIIYINLIFPLSFYTFTFLCIYIHIQITCIYTYLYINNLLRFCFWVGVLFIYIIYINLIFPLSFYTFTFLCIYIHI
jgi:hypothetical protein